MSEQKWTPEPWAVAKMSGHYHHGIDGADGNAVVWLTDIENEGISNPHDAERIVACVNACQGAPETIQPGAVKAMAGALEDIASNRCCATDGCNEDDPMCDAMIARAALRLYHGDDR